MLTASSRRHFAREKKEAMRCFWSFQLQKIFLVEKQTISSHCCEAVIERAQTNECGAPSPTTQRLRHKQPIVRQHGGTASESWSRANWFTEDHDALAGSGHHAPATQHPPSPILPTTCACLTGCTTVVAPPPPSPYLHSPPAARLTKPH